MSKIKIRILVFIASILITAVVSVMVFRNFSCNSSDYLISVSEIKEELNLPSCYQMEVLDELREENGADYSIEYIFRVKECDSEFPSESYDYWKYENSVWKYIPTEDERRSGKFYVANYIRYEKLLIVRFVHL